MALISGTMDLELPKTMLKVHRNIHLLVWEH